LEQKPYDNESKPVRVKRALIALSLIALCVLLTGIVVFAAKGYFIAINDSYSFPNRLYLAKERAPKKIERGSIVIFQIDLPNTPYETKVKDRDLFKRVACMEGDYLERVENRFICCMNDSKNGKEAGEEIAIIRSTDSEGKPYAISFDYNGIIPEGKLFVIAPHDMSFDSRYFGFIDRSAVKGEILWEIY
jgi:signal peptidase I